MEQMEYQLEGLNCIILAQSGNDTPIWRNEFTHKEELEARDYVTKFGNPYDLDRCEYRGCQVSYSMIGHEANPDLKKNFDPKQIIRKAILKQHPFKSNKGY
jgi:hypothetical protein